MSAQSTIRRTGRTTRMLQHILDTCKDGQCVLVFGASDAHAKTLQEAFIALCGSRNLRCEIACGYVRAYSPCSFVADFCVHFSGIDPQRFDLGNCKMTGGFSRDVQYFDHFALEYWTKRMFDEMHRWDA